MAYLIAPGGDIALRLVDVICQCQVFHLGEVIRHRSTRFAGNTIAMGHASDQNTGQNRHSYYLVEEP
ncbi:hypothetical protein D3C86_1860750 [compost metagenome]